MKIRRRLVVIAILGFLAPGFTITRNRNRSLPYWRYQSLTVPNATAAQLEEIMRAGLGSDRAEFTYLGPHQLGITSYGQSPEAAMEVSAKLEIFAVKELEQRGLGGVFSTENDSSAYSDGDPNEFQYCRAHHYFRTLGFRGFHFADQMESAWKSHR
jgi:hypothetical protein